MLIQDILWSNRQANPQKTAVMLGDRQLTYAAFSDRVIRLANALIKLGLEPGDRVAVLLGTCIEYVELYFAVPLAKAVIVPVNTQLTPAETAAVLRDAAPKYFVFESSSQAVINGIQGIAGEIPRRIVVNRTDTDALHYEDLIEQSTADSSSVGAAESDVVSLFYTSGSTGVPKAAMVTHRGLIQNAVSMAAALTLSADDIALSATPLFRAPAMMANIMPLWYVGGTMVLTRDTTVTNMLALIQQARITTTGMVPPALLSLINHPDRGKYDLRSLRHVVYGGLPLSIKDHRFVEREIGRILYKVYAMSEVGTITCLPPVLQSDDNLDSCGPAVGGVRVEIVGDDGETLAPGIMGEVLVHGGIVPPGYWHLPQLSADTMVGDSFHTADLGSIDADGYLYLAGRKKDLIQKDGRSILATEVEQVIGQHPSVGEVAVIGVTSEGSERIHAVIVLTAGAKGDIADEILKFCAGRLPAHARPDTIQFAEALPRGGTGKVLKKLLLPKPVFDY